MVILHWYVFCRQYLPSDWLERLLSLSLSLSLSLRFNGHFPGQPGLARLSRYLLKQRMMEVAVTTGLLEL